MSDEESQADALSITQAIHYKVVHAWRVEGYEQYFSTTKCNVTSIHSSVFGHDDDPGTKWSLQLFPKGDKDAGTGNMNETMSFFINLDKSSDVFELHAKYSVAVLGDERCAHKVTGENTFKRGSGWGRSKFMKIEDLLKDKAIFLVNDALTIRCTVYYTKHVTKEESRKKRRNSDSSVSTEPAKILNTDNIPPDSPESPNQRLSSSFPWHDVTFLVSGSYIRAHKWILTASSPLLAQLVRGCDPLIKIDDVDPEGFSQMIRYIYTGDCDLVNSSVKLISVANKYKLLSLFSKCEDYLLSTLDKKTCFMMYSLGDMYCSNRLKAEAFKVIESLELIGDKTNKLSGTVAVV